MKYHNHEIIKTKAENDCRTEYEYNIYINQKYINTAYSLNNAKEYIDSNYDNSYLC
jgi:hypothetical protein